MEIFGQSLDQVRTISFHCQTLMNIFRKKQIACPAAYSIACSIVLYTDQFLCSVLAGDRVTSVRVVSEIY